MSVRARLVTVIWVSVALCVVTFAPVQATSCAAPSIRIAPTAGVGGTETVVGWSFGGCDDGGCSASRPDWDTVTVEMRSVATAELVASVRAASLGGRFRVELAIPEVPPGDYMVTAITEPDTTRASAPIEVRADRDAG